MVRQRWADNNNRAPIFGVDVIILIDKFNALAAQLSTRTDSGNYENQ